MQCFCFPKGDKILYVIENSKIEKVNPYTKPSHSMQELIKGCELYVSLRSLKLIKMP